MRLFKERDIVCVCVCPNCPLKRSRNNYQSSHSGQEKEMNKIYEEWRRKWDMGDKQAHDGWIPKRKLNKWSSFKIFKYAREEHSIKQRSLHVLWWKGCPVFKKNWCRIISRNTPINFAVPFSLVSYNIQILIHTALQPTLKINKQIKHTFLRSYLLVWKKKKYQGSKSLQQRISTSSQI